MPSRKGFCPEWTWWIRAGERLQLGLDLKRVLDPGPAARRLHAPLARIMEDLEQGHGLVGAFREAGLILPSAVWSLLQAGEQTGRLGEAMREVGERLRERQRRRRELAGQLWYPVLVVATAFLVMLILLLWVIPQMREVSQSMGDGQQLPWLTEYIGWIYGGLMLAGLAVGLGLLGGAAVFRWRGRSSLGWSRLAEELVRRIPLAGQILFLQREATLLRQLGTCLEAGITLPAALGMAELERPGRWERAQLEDFRKRLVLGAGLEACFRDCRLLSPENVQILAVGHECGRLDHYLQRLAVELEERVSWRLSQVLRLLEPLLLLGLSAAVGILLLAYMLPMVRMMEQLA